MIAAGISLRAMALAISSEASGSCLRADHILMESEHSMAREDKDGSATHVEFITVSPGFFSEVFSGKTKRQSRRS
jgi:hypothetical protein